MCEKKAIKRGIKSCMWFDFTEMKVGDNDKKQRSRKEEGRATKHT